MSKRLSESQKHHRQSARFWGKQVLQTIGDLPRYDVNLAWYRQHGSDYAEAAGYCAETIAVEEERLYKNTVRAAHNAGLALDNLWTRYPAGVALEVADRRPEYETDVRAVLTTSPHLTADEAIAILDQARADHAADVAYDESL